MWFDRDVADRTCYVSRVFSIKPYDSRLERSGFAPHGERDHRLKCPEDRTHEPWNGREVRIRARVSPRRWVSLVINQGLAYAALWSTRE